MFLHYGCRHVELYRQGRTGSDVHRNPVRIECVLHRQGRSRYVKTYYLRCNVYARVRCEYLQWQLELD